MIRPLLPTLRMPTLVLHGEHDQMAPAEAGRYIAAPIPGAQLYVFEGRCHAPNWTAPAEFARVLRSFVLTGHPTE